MNKGSMKTSVRVCFGASAIVCLGWVVALLSLIYQKEVELFSFQQIPFSLPFVVLPLFISILSALEIAELQFLAWSLITRISLYAICSLLILICLYFLGAGIVWPLVFFCYAMIVAFLFERSIA